MIYSLIIMSIFALLSAPQQMHFTFPWRKLSEKEFTADLKKAHSRGFHLWTWAVIIFLSSVFGAMGTYLDKGSLDMVYSFLLSAANGFIYSWLFDPAYALSIGEKWDYVGNPANPDPYTVTKWDYKNGGVRHERLENSRTDVIVNKLFGKYAGRWKFIILAILIAAIIFILKTFL